MQQRLSLKEMELRKQKAEAFDQIAAIVWEAWERGVNMEPIDALSRIDSIIQSVQS